MLHRPGADSGGDWTALMGYSQALKDAGVDVQLRPANTNSDLKEFDYVHLWAACAPDWGLPAAMIATKQEARLIVTPFWWSRDERQGFFGNAGRDLRPGYIEAVRSTLRRAEMLFTVTMSEAVECWKLAPGIPNRVVPMGFDEPPLGRKESGDFVLSIGRIEAHKNQLALALVCQKLGYPLILAGIGNAHDDYIRSIKDTGAALLGPVDDSRRWSLLASARVHALPSFFENPGLVHGEALSLGIPSVMGGHGCEPEFYGPDGIYCDPTNLDDILRAVRQAWHTPRKVWADLPTWDDAVKPALEYMEASL